MRMSQGGIDAMLKQFEGCKLTAYKCPAGIWTIGYGHTSAAGAPIVEPGMKITQAQAEIILKADLVRFEQPVEALLKQPVTQAQFDVLVDFAYNAGVGALKTSTLLKKVNAADLDAVPGELMKWTKGGGKVLPGLVRRRQAESAWWSAGEEPIDEQEHRATPDAILAKTMAASKQGNGAILVGALGSVGAAKEILAQVQEANDAFGSILSLATNPQFLMMAAIVGCGAAIWYWRAQHLEQHGV